MKVAIGCSGLPIDETMTRKGQFGLCILGNPYAFGNISSVRLRSLYNFKGICIQNKLRCVLRRPNWQKIKNEINRTPKSLISRDAIASRAKYIFRRYFPSCLLVRETL